MSSEEDESYSSDSYSSLGLETGGEPRRVGNIRLYDEDLDSIRPTSDHMQTHNQATDQQPSGHPRFYDENLRTIWQNHGSPQTNGSLVETSVNGINDITGHTNSASLGHALPTISEHDNAAMSETIGSRTLNQAAPEGLQQTSRVECPGVHGSSECDRDVSGDSDQASVDNQYTNMECAQDEYVSMIPCPQGQNGSSIGAEEMATVYRRRNVSPHAHGSSILSEEVTSSSQRQTDTHASSAKNNESINPCSQRKNANYSSLMSEEVTSLTHSQTDTHEQSAEASEPSNLKPGVVYTLIATVFASALGVAVIILKR